MMFMKISINHMADKIENHGLEVDYSRFKKINKMRRVVELIKNYNESLYIDIAEKEMGELFSGEIRFEPVDPMNEIFSGEIQDDSTNELFEMKDNLTKDQKSHNRKIYERAREIEKEQWSELFEILKGQDYEKLDKDDFENQLDGSGLNTWWD
jgi:hypothetical protein